MALYNIYAGLKAKTCGYNDIKLRGTWEFNTLEEATDAARELAVQRYQSPEWGNGRTWDDCWNELNDDESGPLYSDEEVDDYYYDEVDRYTEYYAVLTAEDNSIL